MGMFICEIKIHVCLVGSVQLFFTGLGSPGSKSGYQGRPTPGFQVSSTTDDRENHPEFRHRSRTHDEILSLILKYPS